MDTLHKLLSYGQSYWLDNLTRKKITSGELSKRVSVQGLLGITSNPSIFNKAITNSNDYDEQICLLVKEGKNIKQIYEAITIKDVQDACDILMPVYTESKGADGFVSLEVAPYLARDTKGTIIEARELHKAVGRSNCLIKVPGTKEGIPAIEQLLYEGININVTLLFSVERYIEVAQVYIQALERRAAENLPVDTIISVASVFLSRIDVLTDQLLGEYVVPQEKNIPPRSESLLGKAGVATARLCYRHFKEIFCTDNWKKLSTKGAHLQRPLWASTSNKDPLFKDLRYVEPLIGQDTINTLPDKTITAFADHGNLKKDTIQDGYNEAKQLFPELKTLGIDIHFVTEQLENDGIKKFTDAYNELLSSLADKRLKLLGGTASPQRISAGKLESEFSSACDSMDEKQVSTLLFSNDPRLWKKDVQQTLEISHRLGWLFLPDNYTSNAQLLIDFAAEIKNNGYTHAVLLGMGGSSLCSEVAREAFGTADGYLQLLVLDNTEPSALLNIEKKINIDKTLFIVASKSGGTKETISFFRYFYDLLEKKNNKNPGDNFVAITDDGTPLVKIANQYKFRKVFRNPPDLGGRYSVLSDFGLVPMALMGIDIKNILENAKQMKTSCEDVPAKQNPGISLGVMLGVCQRHGRDKVTFVLSSSIKSFGYWVEQLIAESTGKEGRGLIPVNGESIGQPGVYSKDRIFVHMYLDTDNNDNDDEKIKALEQAGHPIVRIRLESKIALGGEYYRWEIATAAVGIVMGINPFDQPNVEESKKNTDLILKERESNSSFSKKDPLFKGETISIYAGKKSMNLAGEHFKSVGDVINQFIAQAETHNYVAFLPYFMLTKERVKLLETWREQIRDELKVATTLLNGPRYLHSTGQLHKGGPATGLYILMIGEEKEELLIPEEKFGFATLHEAQALGDFKSLDDKGRKVIRINLGLDIDAGLNKLYKSVMNSHKQLI